MQLKTVNSCTIWLGPQSKLQTQMVCPFLCLLHGNIYGLIEIRPALSLSLSTSLSLSRKKKVSFSLTIFSDSATIFQVLAVHHWFTAPSVPQISQPYQILFTVFIYLFLFFYVHCAIEVLIDFFFCVFENYPFFVFLLCWWVFSYFPESCFLWVKVFCFVHLQALCLVLGCEVYVLSLLFWFTVLVCLLFIISIAKLRGFGLRVWCLCTVYVELVAKSGNFGFGNIHRVLLSLCLRLQPWILISFF